MVPLEKESVNAKKHPSAEPTDNQHVSLWLKGD